MWEESLEPYKAARTRVPHTTAHSIILTARNSDTVVSALRILLKDAPRWNSPSEAATSGNHFQANVPSRHDSHTMMGYRIIWRRTARVYDGDTGRGLSCPSPSVHGTLRATAGQRQASPPDTLCGKSIRARLGNYHGNINVAIVISRVFFSSGSKSITCFIYLVLACWYRAGFPEFIFVFR